jgi:L-threonylcarbamoyladenylate synthase
MTLGPDIAIVEAAAALQDGKLVAFPTETVYGLGADATSDAAVAAVYAAKGRPDFNPLIAHVADLAAAEALVVFPPAARRLAEAFWPGPLTLVLPRRADCPVSLLASAGLDTLAVRVPDHPLALALLRAVAVPVVAPSANPSGGLSPTTAEHVRAGLGDKVGAILDGGPCRVGVESTVVDLSGPAPLLLRPGGVSREAIEAILATALGAVAGGPLRSPGQLDSHYAPHLPVRLNATSVRPDEALLVFGTAFPAGAAMTLNLSPAGDTVEAAAHLFAYLRRLDRPELAGIAVTPIPEDGLGLAINDRLRRAAAPRGTRERS